MNGTQRGTTNGYSLFAFMVLNDSSVTPISFKIEKKLVSSGLSLQCQNNAVHYSIPNVLFVKLEAFDAQGKLAAILTRGSQPSGAHVVSLPASLGKGIFVFRLTAGAMMLVAMQVRP
jgi:hypothetical protein